MKKTISLTMLLLGFSIGYSQQVDLANAGVDAENNIIKGCVDIANLEVDGFSSSNNVVSLKVSFATEEL